MSCSRKKARPVSQIFDSESDADNFKADRSDSSSSKLDSSAELDDKARESDDDILGLIGDSKKLKATLDDEVSYGSTDLIFLATDSTVS